MKFHFVLVVLTALFAFISCEYNVRNIAIRSHPRRLSVRTRNIPQQVVPRGHYIRSTYYKRSSPKGSPKSSPKTPPKNLPKSAPKGGSRSPSPGLESLIPATADKTKLQAFLRIDQTKEKYTPHGQVHHDGLNKVMEGLGGQHVDVVIGNNNEGYFLFGLQFANSGWIKTSPNGDGYAIDIYVLENYAKGSNDKLVWKGTVDGRKTLKSIAADAKSLGAGKTYNHLSFNCNTFAQALLARLNLKV